VAEENFDGCAIDVSMFDWIRQNLPDGSKILEFGSGTGTIELAKHYEVTCIEDSSEWMDVAKDAHYIYAPLKDNWYDWTHLEVLKDETFDLILVDGPFDLDKRHGIVEWCKENPRIFGEAVLIVDDNNCYHCSDMIRGFKNLDWEHIHQYFCEKLSVVTKGVIHEWERHWGVYQKRYECLECASEFLKLSESLNCCVANFK
tara:strand:+ start:1418 stop:2020 length:603 start_codon:yes stop_codon:yes gene_type:complete